MPDIGDPSDAVGVEVETHHPKKENGVEGRDGRWNAVSSPQRETKHIPNKASEDIEQCVEDGARHIAPGVRDAQADDKEGDKKGNKRISHAIVMFGPVRRHAVGTGARRRMKKVEEFGPA